ncbi:MAG: dephospho-CoA kinase [Parvularculaceae bacterium]
MIVVGLTGSIGMGKSTVLKMFADLGARTWSADEAVHRLYALGGAAVSAIGAAIPGCISDGAVDRARLSKILLGEPALLARVEAIVHPLVAEDRARFLEAARAARAGLAVLDIPLLFEKGYERGFDAVIVVSAAAHIQKKRVLARRGMSAEKFAAILAKQMPDSEKRQRADYVISTDRSLAATRSDVEQAIADLGRRFP